MKVIIVFWTQFVYNRLQTIMNILESKYVNNWEFEYAENICMIGNFESIYQSQAFIYSYEVK